VPERWNVPKALYRAARAQLGSVRNVYLGGNRIERKERFERPELVLLLHGFFQTRNIWEVMEDRLRYDGFGVISFNLAGLFHRLNTRPVERIAAQIADKIDGLANRHGFEALHIVGHSKGGLIARRYIQHHGGDSRVKSLITLGTPHHGTPTALIGRGLLAPMVSSAPDLLPRSRLVRALNRDPFPSHIPLTSVYSKSDLVCPYWTSVLRPREGEDIANVEVTDVGHSELAWDAGVYKIVRDRLIIASEAWQQRRDAVVAP
jgi:triacylglycerol lipase